MKQDQRERRSATAETTSDTGKMKSLSREHFTHGDGNTKTTGPSLSSEAKSRLVAALKTQQEVEKRCPDLEKTRLKEGAK
jgi:hypothetical protein